MICCFVSPAIKDPAVAAAAEAASQSTKVIAKKNSLQRLFAKTSTSRDAIIRNCQVAPVSTPGNNLCISIIANHDHHRYHSSSSSSSSSSCQRHRHSRRHRRHHHQPHHHHHHHRRRRRRRDCRRRHHHHHHHQSLKTLLDLLFIAKSCNVITSLTFTLTI